MTKLVGQDGSGWTQVAGNDPATGSAEFRIAGGYVAIAGTMSTVHVVVGGAGVAGHKATAYVYIGSGPGATFLAMSDEFLIDSTGEKIANISGTLNAGTYL